MHTRTFEATSSGEASVDLYGYDSNIEVVADPSCRKAYVEVYTEANSGSSVETIDALPGVRGNDLRVHLPKGAGGSGSGSVIVSGGSVVIGSGNVTYSGRGFTSVMSGGGGDSDMVVNGNRIVTRGGRTWVNGVEITEQGQVAGPAGDPPMPIHFRAVVPYGSTAKAETYNGDIATADVGQVHLKSYSGDIRATGLAAESKIKTYKGDVTVGAASGQRPAVNAETYNGDIRALDDDIRLRPKTYNGDVRYPR
jgi:hypothetical protein